MGYNSAEDLVNGSQTPQIQLVKLAEVTSLDSKGRAKVRFYGEDTEAGKTYNYIDGYIPEVGDKVLMLGQGNTYIIIGAVEAEEVIVKYALKDHNHDEVYVKKTEYDAHTHSSLINGKKTLEVTSAGEVIPGADAEYSLGTEDIAFAEGYVDNIIVSYITISGTKLEKKDLISKIIASGNSDYYVELATSDLVPHTNKGISLGTSTKMFNNVYAQTVYAGGKEVSPSKLIDAITSGRYVQLSSSVLEPSADGVINFGSANKRYSKAYVKTYYGDAYYLDDYELSPSRIYSNSRTDQYVEMIDNTFTPSSSGLFNLGSANRQFSRIYSKEIYLNGSAISTSDKRKKKGIKNLAGKYYELFKKLRPVTFKYKNGTSGRMHAGFVAQEVEQAMQECGISNEEFGGLIIQDNGEYGLRYEEFIALQTAVIQDLQKKVEELERRVNNDRV